MVKEDNAKKETNKKPKNKNEMKWERKAMRMIPNQKCQNEQKYTHTQTTTSMWKEKKVMWSIFNKKKKRKEEAVCTHTHVHKCWKNAEEEV